jgi:nicotinate-nucleotide adenylyltransferase
MAKSELKRLGILGGTFDPPHLAHLRIAEEVREEFSLDRVAFIPAGFPPHKKPSTYSPFHHRWHMVTLSINQNPYFFALDIEKDQRPSYTLNTLKKLKKLYPKTQLFFIIGPDAFFSIHTWWRWRELPDWANFVVLMRREETSRLEEFKVRARELFEEKAEAFFFFENTSISISSSMIRRLVKQGRSIKYLVVPEVEEYIKKEGLYL